jgi:hypothetical protein
MRRNPEGPPKPTPMLCVGVTGHRPEKLTEDAIKRLRPQLEAVLKTLLKEMRRVTALSADCFGGPARLRVLSAAAEGADRIFARVGLESGSDLQLILPFERGNYALDFPDDASKRDYYELVGRASAVVELDGKRANAPQAYLAAGKLIVELCDVLVALWDGQQPAGVGGTADIVAQALAADRPVIWLNTAEKHAVVVRQGDQADDASPDAVKALAGRLAASFAPPSENAGSPSSGWLAKAFRTPSSHRAYQLERSRRWTGGGFFAAFRDLVVARPSWPRMRIPPFEPVKDSVAFTKSLASRSPLFRDAAPALQRLNMHYVWADRLSVYYADLYRSGYTANYLLAACAVAFALLGIPLPEAESVGPSLELACIAVILAITLRGWGRRWHSRWIAYRQLAEQLRTFRFLTLLCTRPLVPDMPKHLAGGDKQTAWVGWLYAVILREIGLPTAKINPAYLAAARDWIAHGEVTEQAEYHRDSSHRLHTFDHYLHLGGVLLFAATAIACVAHLAVHHWSPERLGLTVGPWLTFFSGALPALGGAFLAIRNQGEFAEVAKQSKRMSLGLDQIRSTLMQLEGGAPSRERLADAAKQLAEIMLAETGYWHVVFLGKPLALPG